MRKVEIIKALIKFSFPCILSTIAILVSAQKNIAPDAKLYTNVGINTTFPPERTNDKVISACGTQEAYFIWNPSAGLKNPYLEWEWSVIQFVNRIVIYHGQTNGRFLNGGTIERWDGKFWVTHFTFSNLTVQCENTVNFPVLIGTKMRISNWTLANTGRNDINPNFREIEIYTQLMAPLNAGIYELISPLSSCTSNQDMSVGLLNTGRDKIDSTLIEWSINDTLQKSFSYNKYPNFLLKDTIPSGKLVKVTVQPSYQLKDLTTYNLKFWSSMPNGMKDTVNTDDTLGYTLNFLGSPKTPVVKDFKHCRVGKIPLTCTPGDTNDLIIWWDKANGGNIIGLGKNILTPFIYKTDSFFVEAARKAKPSLMDNGFNGKDIVSASPENNGGYLDFTTREATLALDSMTFRLYFKLPRTGYRLYYRNGGYSGFEKDSTKWQLLKQGVGKFTTDAKGIDYFLTVENLDLVLTANTKYSFYFTTDSIIEGNDIFAQTGPTTKTNDELTISGGAISWGLFGSRGIYTFYTLDVRVGYKRSCPSSSRAKVVVTVVPSPAGATLLKGTPFNGVYNAGTLIDPDAASETRTISYELLPPTKFSNFTYGTNWKINSITMSTINGTPIPSVDTVWNLPSAANGNGKLSYTPSIGWGDSTIVIIVNIYDISLACDSVLERYIIVAPTPIPDFISSDVCLGMNIEFVNKSTISSGLMKYYWDFDDGNFSDNQSPIHLYSKSGLYKVRLTVTSNLGIVNDTVIVVNVFDLPEIKFSVKNECEGVDLSFENLTTVSTGTLSYVWSFGDGQTSTATSPSHLYAMPGSYKVTLVASANRCLSSLSKNANQFARPKAAFNTSGVCSGKEVTFINTSTIGLGEKVGTIWNYGDGEFGTLTIQKHIYATAGTKNVKMYAVSQFGCKDSASKNLVVKPSPIANFSYDKICDIDPVNFSNSTTEPAGIPVVYNWEFGDGGVSILKSPTHKYNALGPKKITLVATGANGCFTQIDKNVEVLAQPIAAFEVSSVCANEQITFVNKSKVSKGEMQYNWTFGDGNSSNDFSPKKVYNPATSTTYTVVLETTVLGGCSDKETKSVDIKEKPKCGFTAKVSPNDRLTWTFTPNDNSYGPKAYTWVFVGSNISHDISPTHTFDYYDIQYRVILSVLTSEGCHCLDSGFYLTTSWGVGMQNQKLQSVPILYPNPSNGLMTLEISDWTLKEQTTLTVFDATGRVVKILDITDTHTDKQIIDLSDMASGLYNLNVACISWPSKTFKVLLSR